MKKSFITLLLVAVATTTFSQVTFKPGIRSGVNLSSISNTDTDTKTDFYFGAFLEMQLSNKYALQPEVNYSRQGAKNKISSGQDSKLEYVGLHIINKFAPFNNIGLSFIVGPGIDIKVSDNLNFSDSAPLDLVFFGGVGYDFPSGLSVEARYKQGIIDYDDGFSEFGDSSDPYYDGDENNLNGVIQIGVSYKFDFSK